MSLRLRGIFTVDINSKTTGSSSGSGSCQTKTNDDRVFWFENEGNKKTSFVFDESSLLSSSTTTTGSQQRITIQKPCHLFLDCCHPLNDSNDVSNTTEFLFGGLEIHSNSRNIEVYALPEDSDGKDNNNSFEYLKTCRGTMIINDDDDNTKSEMLGDANEGQEITAATRQDFPKESWEKEMYKTVIIPPNSKPISILRLHLKLLSLRPAKCNIGYIKQVKLKGRIPDVQISTSKPEPQTKTQSSHEGKTSLHTSLPQSIQGSSQNENNRPPNNQIPSVNNEELNRQTSQITNAISAVTMLIQNTQQTMERSISTSIGEVQKLTFQQSQHFHNTLQSLERRINEVNNNLNELRNEVHALNISHRDQTQCDESSHDDRDVGVNESDHAKDCNSVKTNEDVHVKEASEKSENDLQTILQEYVEKIQEKNRRDIEQLLVKERKVLLDEMDRKRDEIIDEVTKKMNNSKEVERLCVESAVSSSDSCTAADDVGKGEKPSPRILSLSPPASPKLISLSPPASPKNSQGDDAITTQNDNDEGK